MNTARNDTPRETPLLSVERLTMRFGGLLAIDDLSLDVAARQITG
ncbi:MAG TPA: ABC transporter ATP-binding protein, partial [Accumulibacter sp.]|nr:ABC transporter ATP-binding protein [Accumulibacter sp.]